MKYYSILILAFFLLSSTPAQEGDFTYDPESKSIKVKYLGKVFLIKGKVTAYSSKGEETILENQSKVFPGDKLVTSEKSIVKIEMIDTTIITVASSSEFEFTKWDYKTKDDRNALFSLLKGKMRSHIKVKNKQESSLKYQVGSVSMGIRGTRILANSYTREDKVKVAHVVVLSGSTEIYDSAADKKFNLESGSEYISFLRPDGSLLKQTETILSPSRLKELKANDKNPRKYFKPFLAFINSKDLKNTSTVDTMGKESLNHSQREVRKNSKKKKSWKKTLEQLNERLEESDD